jgi:formylglycine-generating enzyme required for sulfatase activity
MGCSIHTSRDTLDVVTYADFEQFVQETGYVTDAERYGWSIVSSDVFSYNAVPDATWKKPDGVNPPTSKDLPVTQVSYNDALAYCEWSGTKLPTYEQYWELVNSDNRAIVTENKLPISPTGKVNIVGNVWEITSTKRGGEVRLAGGSLFCSVAICDGTSKTRELFVDRQTGNIHIGFAVIRQ